MPAARLFYLFYLESESLLGLKSILQESSEKKLKHLQTQLANRNNTCKQWGVNKNNKRSLKNIRDFTGEFKGVFTPVLFGLLNLTQIHFPPRCGFFGQGYVTWMWPNSRKHILQLLMCSMCSANRWRRGDLSDLPQCATLRLKKKKKLGQIYMKVQGALNKSGSSRVGARWARPARLAVITEDITVTTHVAGLGVYGK